MIYPVDMIRTRMLAAAFNTSSSSSDQNSTILRTVRHLVKTEGSQTLFRGVTPCLLRGFPVNATVFYVYEFLIALSWKSME